MIQSGGSEPGDRRSSSQRLPVNPRRHKVAPEQRKRVATACNSCNVRRIKCSGDRPCHQCSSAARECVYPPSVEKVSISRSELDSLRRKVEAYEKVLTDAGRASELLQHQSPLSEGAASPGGTWAPSVVSLDSAAAAATQSSEHEDAVAPGGIDSRLLRDGDGVTRFFGETSAAAFLDHLNEFMNLMTTSLMYHQHSPSPSQAQPIRSSGAASSGTLLPSSGTYHTRDSRPLRTVDVSPLWVPPAPSLSAMLAELRSVIQDGGNGERIGGGIYFWGDLALAENRDDMAFVNAALAVLYYRSTGSRAQQQRSGGSPKDSPQPSEVFFSRAIRLLSNPLDVSRRADISDVATLSLLGLYLIQTNRCDAAAMYISTAIRTGVMLGAHRGWVDERGKRTFWTAYVLDRWVSCVLGRPPSIADEAVQLPPPEDALGMPSPAGLRAHVELARISGNIVAHASGVSTTGMSSSFAQNLERTTWLLEQWESSLPAALRLNHDGASDDPTVCLLHMQHNHLIMMATRPVFFAAVKRTLAERLGSGVGPVAAPHPELRHLQNCASAAQHILDLARRVAAQDSQRRGPSSPPILLHAGLQNIFDAVVCLLLQELVTDTSIADEELASRNGAVEFAVGCFEDEGGDFARDAAGVVARLKGLVEELRLRMRGADRLEGGSALYGDLVAMMGGDWPLTDEYDEFMDM
ncbi:hypothetical protein S40285_04367 [Stachybotrys chlorohalonatus IBT 40285]|uniref:Zn(2)-C6 fungal-type domain-containing protein n=1 Tax=Stachybotrys chlorohalonatus (strain IBT 40285) TaxID=1283841 RepID=A0A084QG52_STAC4|nr:hypothetical protein S40285_04367 [Stachybotrys chlorohalonata IBT 40285]